MHLLRCGTLFPLLALLGALDALALPAPLSRSFFRSSRPGSSGKVSHAPDADAQPAVPPPVPAHPPAAAPAHQQGFDLEAEAPARFTGNHKNTIIAGAGIAGATLLGIGPAFIGHEMADQDKKEKEKEKAEKEKQNGNGNGNGGEGAKGSGWSQGQIAN